MLSSLKEDLLYSYYVALLISSLNKPVFLSGIELSSNRLHMGFVWLVGDTRRIEKCKDRQSINRL